MGISGIASATGINKSTVYNLVHSLVDLSVLNRINDKYCFGARLYLLGQIIDYESLLVGKFRPMMQDFSERTQLTTSLGVRSGRNLIVLERIKVSGGIDVFMGENKIRPLLDGVYGSAVLTLLSDTEIDAMLDDHEFTAYTSNTITDKRIYRKKIQKALKEGVAIEQEEYYDGIWAIAAPIKIDYLNIQSVIWAFGLTTRANPSDIRSYASLLKQLAVEINHEINTQNAI
jgi:DNA-binding IclR family transcriptional regulator